MLSRDRDKGSKLTTTDHQSTLQGQQKQLLEIRDLNKKHLIYFTDHETIESIFPAFNNLPYFLKTIGGKVIDKSYKPTDLDVLYAYYPIKGGSKASFSSKNDSSEFRHKVTNPMDNRSISVVYINMDGLKHKQRVIKPLLEDNSWDVMFIGEAKVDKYQTLGYPFVFHTGTINNNFGMAVALHPKYLTRELVILSSSPYHVVVQFQGFQVMGIYIPSHIQNKHQFYLDNLHKYVTSVTLLFGDFNMPLNNPTTTQDHLMLEDLISKRLIYHDLENTQYTFEREMNGQLQRSFVDHVIAPLNGSVTLLSAHSQRISCTYHSAIVCKIASTEIPLLPKNPKIRSYKLREEKRHEEFQLYLRANVSRIRGRFQVLANVPFQASNSTNKDRSLEILNDIYGLLSDSIVDAATKSLGLTKPVQAKFSSESDNLGRQMLQFYNAHTKQRSTTLSKKFIRSYKSATNELDSCQFIKQLKYKKRRKYNPRSMLNPENIDDYIDKWFDKWNHPSYTNVNPDYPVPICSTFRFTIEHLRASISKLPKGKTPGCDQIDGELIQHADESFLNLLLQFINLCLSLGHLPSKLRLSDIIPIYKKLAGNCITHHRPIALSSHIRKLIEIMLKDQIQHIFATSANHYGYKSDTSIHDAVYDIGKFIEYLQNLGIPYKMIKFDAKGAFDGLSRQAVFEMIERANCDGVLKRLLWSLAGSQDFRIRLGQYTSKIIPSNRGVIQGGVTSPLIFIKTLDDAFSSWDTSFGRLFFFADDILLITTIDDATPAIVDIKTRLASIGLELEDSKTETINESNNARFTKYLGYWINHHGTNVDMQVSTNIANARYRLKEFIRLGIFRNALDSDKLLKSFSCFVFPILEFGLHIWQPDKKNSNSINGFIRASIRSLTGTARSTPISDIEEMFQFSDFNKRWAERHIRWHNHRCFKENDPCTMFAEKVKMAFKPHPKLEEVSRAFPRIMKVLQRQLPRLPVHCFTCNTVHSVPNQTIKCCYQHAIQNVEMEINHPLHNKTAMNLDNYLLQYKRKLLDLQLADKIVICTDGSLVLSPYYASAAYVIIYNNQIFYQSYNISNLRVQSSTRAEIIALILALNDPRIQNCNLPVETYLDSKAAISNILHYKSGRNFRNVHTIDLMTKSEILNTPANYSWVKGHDTHVGNNLADLLCNIRSVHRSDHNLTLNENHITKITTNTTQASTYPLFSNLVSSLAGSQDSIRAIKNITNIVLESYFSNG